MKYVFIYVTSSGEWKNSTQDIIKIDDQGNSFKILFKGYDRPPRSYNFKSSKVKFLDNYEEYSIDLGLLKTRINDIVEKVYVSLDSPKKYVYFNKKIGLKSLDAEVVKKIELDLVKSQNLVDYYKAMADIMDSSSESGQDFLKSQYERISANYSDNNILSDVLYKKIYTKENTNEYILPFVHNESQYDALRKGLCNNISIIQGPPGSGKTQTILNIISNIVVQGKTVAIVSNNNKAVENVFEKLQENNLGFLCAQLGSISNREEFFAEESIIPNLSVNLVDNSVLKKLVESESLMYKKESELCKTRSEYETLVKEFEKYTQEECMVNCDDIFFSNNYKENHKLLLKFANELERRGREKDNIFHRIKYWLKYNAKYVFTRDNLSELSHDLKVFYIKLEIDSQKNKIDLLEKEVEDLKSICKPEQVVALSKQVLINALSKKYNKYKKEDDDNFVLESYKKKFDSFIDRYPIILSSTFSLPSSVSRSFKFDYVIIDEASQSTITTVLPSIAIAKQLIVIGDEKQLPPVFTNDVQEQEEELSKNYFIEDSYRDNGKSFLGFISSIFNDIPTTLLKEHYRCARQIINFSNRKFYSEKLEIIKDIDNDDHLMLRITADGNHARKGPSGRGLYNQREVDTILSELDILKKSGSIGIITPYRAQAECIRQSVSKDIQVGTVHTFQGREFDTIIFSTVANNLNQYKEGEIVRNSFIDNESLINVAITRAKNKFILVTSSGLNAEKTGILADLIKYIKYETSDIETGKIKSVFDVLYKEEEFVRWQSKNDDVLSEKEFAKLLDKIMKEDKFLSLKYSSHVTLRDFISVDTNVFSESELKYIKHPWTHVDFLIINKYDKKPILGIEIDGIKFHEQNEKQLVHDSIKTKAFENAEIPLIRFKTNGSNEYSIVKEELLKNLQ